MRDLNLLVIDDDDLLVAALRQSLPKSWRLTAADGPGPLPETPIHAALVDMHLTGRTDRAEGLEILKILRARDPHLSLIAMSGNMDRDLMEKGLRAGADRFLAKPLGEELNLLLDKIEEWWLLRGALQRGAREAEAWLGQSPEAHQVQRQIAELKGEKGPILIEGESGTGKEVVARLLHEQNDSAPFVAANMAGIPENLFESELFGHVRGAFTGADQNKMGLAEAASGGDLFLDEIEAMPLSQQAKLLRFLELGEIRRVGAKDPIHVRCRVIVATNQPLNQLVREGKFREDLLWRLSGKKLTLPPLRRRREDIGLLAKEFLNRDPYRKKELAQDGLDALMEHSWPGNVRELKRVCEQLVIQAPLPLIRRVDVVTLLQPSIPGDSGENIDFTLGLTELGSRYEARVIAKCLERFKDIDEVARILDVSRSNLYKKIKDYNISWRES